MVQHNASSFGDEEEDRGGDEEKQEDQNQGPRTESFSAGSVGFEEVEAEIGAAGHCELVKDECSLSGRHLVGFTVGPFQELQRGDCVNALLALDVADDYSVSVCADADAGRDCASDLRHGYGRCGVGHTEDHQEGGPAVVVAQNDYFGPRKGKKRCPNSYTFIG